MTNTAPTRWTRSDRLAVVALVVLAGVVFGRGITVGGLRDGDSSAHAMDGVLILDWVRAGPGAWLDPMGFAREQYAHYPTLAIGRHYPPGFAVVEAAFFALFGISAITARACVVAFGAMLGVGCFAFTRRFSDTTTAALAGVFMITMPAIVLWGRQEMLEAPTLAVMTIALCTAARYLERPSGRRLIVMMIALAAGLTFRQTAVFLIGAVAITMALGALTRRVPRSHAAVVLALAVGCAALVVLSLDGHGAKLLRGDKTFADTFGFESLSFYVREAPQSAGVVVLCLAAAGLAWAIVRSRTAALLCASWLAVGYVGLSIADYKNPRFLCALLTPLAVFSAIGAERATALLPGRVAGRVVLTVTAAALVVVAVVQPIAFRPDYGPVVVAHRDELEGHVVLFSGLRAGDFSFAARQYLPWRRIVVVRTSKLLYTCSGRPDLDLETRVASLDDVAAVLDRFAFDALVVEREEKVGVPPEAWLREVLAKQTTYTLADEHPLPAGDVPSFRDVTLDVYVPRHPGVRQADHIDIPLPRLGETVRIDLNPQPRG